MNPDKASSEANYMFTEIMNYPPMVKVQEEIAEKNIFFVPGSEQQQLLDQYSEHMYQAWMQFKKSPKYADYTKNVKQYLDKDFEVDKMVDAALKVSSRYGPQLKDPYHQAVTDPAAKAVFSTWANEGKQFATDIGVASHLKGKFPGMEKRHERWAHDDRGHEFDEDEFVAAYDL